jgi:hypothetical protein
MGWSHRCKTERETAAEIRGPALDAELMYQELGRIFHIPIGCSFIPRYLLVGRASR